MTQAALVTEALSKEFRSGGHRVAVLDGVSFQVRAGESLAVMGRSGSGKSTLLNLLCGLETPDTGLIIVDGETFDCGGARYVDKQWGELRRRSIGVVFQEANLMPALSLLDNVRLRTHLAGQRGGDERHWLERLGLAAEADRYPDQVSGGQAQRAALAMVFAMAPTLILADEPTGSLDRHTADQVADCLFAMQRETGCALVLATHDAGLGERCDECLDLTAAG